MPIHLRQICLVAESLQPAVDDLIAVLGIEPCHVDPEVGKWGLENTLLPIGSNFLEVVAPLEDDTSAGRHLARRHGDGGYMVICQATTKAEQDATRSRAQESQTRIAYESDRDTWRLMQLHPGDMQGAYLEVDWDEQADPIGNWMPAGGIAWQSHTKSNVTQRITGAELQGPDPLAMAQHWGRVCGVQPVLSNGTPIVPLANASLRFVSDKDGRGPGLGGIDIQTSNPTALLQNAQDRSCLISDQQVMICGTRINIA